jgi:putative transposase
MAENPSRRSSKPRPAASRPLVRRAARREANLLAVSEPDPALRVLRDRAVLRHEPGLIEALNDEDLTAIRTYLQRRRAYGRESVQTIIEAKTLRFAAIRPAHRKPRGEPACGK